MEKLEGDFNAKIGLLIKLVCAKKSSSEILDARDKFETLRSHTPSEIIKIGGPKIWEYRDQIGTASEKFNVEFFLNLEVHGGNDIIFLIAELRSLWSKLSEKEHDKIIRIVRNLLSIYAAYLSECKK